MRRALFHLPNLEPSGSEQARHSPGDRQPKSTQRRVPEVVTVHAERLQVDQIVVRRVAVDVVDVQRLRPSARLARRLAILARPPVVGPLFRRQSGVGTGKRAELPTEKR